MSRCIKCESNVPHAWHDNGTPNLTGHGYESFDAEEFADDFASRMAEGIDNIAHEIAKSVTKTALLAMQLSTSLRMIKLSGIPSWEEMEMRAFDIYDTMSKEIGTMITSNIADNDLTEKAMDDVREILQFRLLADKGVFIGTLRTFWRSMAKQFDEDIGR